MSEEREVYIAQLEIKQAELEQRCEELQKESNDLEECRKSLDDACTLAKEEKNLWMLDARRYAQNADYWKEELDKLRARIEGSPKVFAIVGHRVIQNGSIAHEEEDAWEMFAKAADADESTLKESGIFKGQWFYAVPVLEEEKEEHEK